MRYLIYTKDYVLVIKKTGDMKITGYTDADFAGDLDERVSTSGYVIRVGGAPVMWRSKRQGLVTTSSTEAEYVSANMAGKAMLYVKKLLQDFGIEPVMPMTLFEDNKSCIAMTQREGYNSRSKHIDVRYHYIRYLVAEGLIEMQYCHTNEMVADMFTKGGS